jgi:pimeloyl-ACP methyl ester carboxylesterase
MRTPPLTLARRRERASPSSFERDSREAHAVVRFIRRNEVLLRIVRPWPKTIARRVPLRAIAFRDVVAHPSRLDASLALAGLEGASNCAITGSAVGALVDEMASAAGWAAIECPIRIAVSMGDRILDRPGHYARMRRLLPDADWISLEGLGHVPMTDDPARISEVILEVSAPGRRSNGER